MYCSSDDSVFPVTSSLVEHLTHRRLQYWYTYKSCSLCHRLIEIFPLFLASSPDSIILFLQMNKNVLHCFLHTESLKNYFLKFGDVTDVVVMKDPATKKHR